MTDPIRVLIADDHPLFRDGLTAMLQTGDDTERTCAATDGRQAVELALHSQPDVVVMDLHMPGMDGIEATRRIVADSPHIAVLVLTMFDDDDSVFAVMRAGARGYLLKDADRDELLRAISAVWRGEAIFSPAIAQRMMSYFAAGPGGSGRRGVGFPYLSECECEWLGGA